MVIVWVSMSTEQPPEQVLPPSSVPRRMWSVVNVNLPLQVPTGAGAGMCLPFGLTLHSSGICLLSRFWETGGLVWTYINKGT